MVETHDPCRVLPFVDVIEMSPADDGEDPAHMRLFVPNVELLPRPRRTIGWGGRSPGREGRRRHWTKLDRVNRWIICEGYNIANR